MDLTWLTDNLSTFQALGRDIAYFASGATALATILNLKRRLAEHRQRGIVDKHAKRKLAEEKKLLSDHARQVRSEWYVRVCRDLVVIKDMKPDHFAGLNVQQVCAHIGCQLPAWAVQGWQCVTMAMLNRTVSISDLPDIPDFCNPFCSSDEQHRFYIDRERAKLRAAGNSVV